MKTTVSRRTFVQTAALAAAAGFGLRPELRAQEASVAAVPGTAPVANGYDEFAKLASNENPYGPSAITQKTMTGAFKYSNRYRYPDSGIVPTIAAHNGVRSDNVLLGAGSSEILHMAASAFLGGGKKVVGVEPTYSAVYEYATGLKNNAIRLRLRDDYRQDTPALIKAVKDNAADVGLVYICNPNNPTGVIVPKQEIKQLLDEIPAEIPVLIDEAYHEYVEDPNYATSVPYVVEGRPVVIARTFSKLFGLAGMRLGYAIAPSNLIDRLRAHTSGMSINALVKFGAVAALRDVAAQDRVRAVTAQLRKKVAAELESLGYSVSPSQTNFFMVHLRRPVNAAIQEFRQRGVLVGRPFPPLLEHLRVSIGTADEMDRFMKAFREIFV